MKKADTKKIFLPVTPKKLPTSPAQHHTGWTQAKKKK
jgi:hypothetical protein